MSKRNGDKKGKWIACIAIICTLLVALGSLTAYTVVTTGELKKTVSQMKSELNRQKDKVDDSSHELEDKDAIIAQQEQDLKEKDDTIAEKENENAELKKENAELKGQNAELKDENEDLKDEVADLEAEKALQSTKPGDPNLPVMGEMSDYKGQKIVALTFDDGPGPYTERLLDEMKKRGARATFFVLGTRVDAYPKLIRRMAAEGHVVGNHSNAHNMLHRMNLVGVRKEMGKCAEKIEKLLGYRPPVMRCPGGNSSSVVEQYAKEAGVPILYWGVDTRDWESRNKDAILKVCKSKIRDGSIVLLHDIHKTSVDAAIELMDWLDKEGYTMVTVPELLCARRGGMVAGKTYS